MHTTPPELPPLPTQPQPTSSFISVVGWIGFALALFGALYGLTQVLGGLFAPKDVYLRMMNPGGRPLSLPPAMQWFYTHTLLVGTVELLLSALFAWASWNLLKRREAARIVFVACLLLGMAWQFGSLWLMPQLVDGILSTQAAALPPGRAMPGELKDIMRMSMLMGSAVGLLIATVLGWTAWKLCTRGLRAQFIRSDSRWERRSRTPLQKRAAA